MLDCSGSIPYVHHRLPTLRPQRHVWLEYAAGCLLQDGRVRRAKRPSVTTVSTPACTRQSRTLVDFAGVSWHRRLTALMPTDVIRSEQHPVVPIAIRCPRSILVVHRTGSALARNARPPKQAQALRTGWPACSGETDDPRLACDQHDFSLACDRHYQHCGPEAPEQRGRVLSPDNCAR